jgi:hypothetical protein
MYLFCNSRIHVITLYSGHVCVYYAPMLRCWHLVQILVRTDHPCLGVRCHNRLPPSPAIVCPVASPCLTSFHPEGRVGRAQPGKAHHRSSAAIQPILEGTLAPTVASSHTPRPMDVIGSPPLSNSRYCFAAISACSNCINW